MSFNDHKGWIAWVIGILTILTLGSTVLLRVLNVESKEQATAARGADKIELRGEINAVDQRHTKAIEEIKGDVRWVREALYDGGYRSPADKKKKQ